MDFVEIGLKLTYTLLGVGVLAAIVMPLFQAVTQDPKSMVKAAMGVGVLAVIYFMGYALATNEVTSTYVEFGVDSAISKRIGGLLIAMYLLMGAALLGIVFTEISKLVK